MRTIYGVLGWGIVALGTLHMASTPRALTPASLWFFSGGMTMVLIGALNLLNRAYGDAAPGLHWFCAAATAATTVFTLIGGVVTRASIGALAVIGGWMAATTVLSAMRRSQPAR